jgi:hypothetical protein
MQMKLVMLVCVSILSDVGVLLSDDRCAILIHGARVSFIWLENSDGLVEIGVLLVLSEAFGLKVTNIYPTHLRNKMQMHFKWPSLTPF